MARWTSVHCFLADPALAERFLVERAAPVAKAWHAGGEVQRWFFVRYWEGGPHLRLRFEGTVAPAAAVEVLADGIDRWTSADPPRREAYYAAHSFDGAPVDRDALPWFAEGSVVAIDYQPEVVRYGGPAAMARSEALFERSSELALALVSATASDLPRRTAAAAPLMAATMLALSGDADDLAWRLNGYAAFWRGYSNGTRTLAARLAEPLPSDPGLVAAVAALLNGRAPRHVAAWAAETASFARDLQALGAEGLLMSPVTGAIAADPASRAEAVAAVMGSQLHMLNNRLGLAPAAEMLLAAALGRAAAEIAGSASAFVSEIAA